MRRSSLSRVIVIATAALAGCATLKAEDVKIYEPTQLRESQYESVARLWVETWRTLSWVPTYASPGDGFAALQDKAASTGANGLTNVACYSDPGLFSLGSPTFVCYGKAIKVR
ncbi:MAG TPA: hypothetical protein VEF92_00035 [Burkholderiales bacterium]|nr:hypothetical protein [Burkholderiales bacterium]